MGNNGDYSAGPGWDPCTGLGTPDGKALLEALRPLVAAAATMATTLIPIVAEV